MCGSKYYPKAKQLDELMPQWLDDPDVTQQDIARLFEHAPTRLSNSKTFKKWALMLL